MIPDILFLTFEEINRDATKVNIGETSVGVQSGPTQALAQGRVTTDMKWIDIKIKDLRKKINDQSVEDAKKGLLDIAS